MGTVLQWRKFNFFDVKTYMESSLLEEPFNNVEITVSASSRGVIYIGDKSGKIFTINRQLQISVFPAHDYDVKMILTDDNSNFLITIDAGDGSASTLKIWSLDRINSQGYPSMMRQIRYDHRVNLDDGSVKNCLPNITAATFLYNSSLLAVGFSDGSILFYKDFHRERGSRVTKLSCNLNSPITNLHLRPFKKATYLFVTTERNIYCIHYGSKDKETLVELDKNGCLRGCSALADSKHEYELLVARDDAIYGYTTDSRTSCYIFEGKKVSLSWFRGYFVVVFKEDFHSRSRHTLTIYDPANKLVTINTEIENFLNILNEWGGLYVLTSDPSLLHISEIDLQSKLDLLFKKNQFDIAISIAKMQYCDQEEVAEILTQYGDWLYDKGNSTAAMEQYIKTIPHLEPSYVIKKFLDTQYIENLATYLQALHKSGYATSNHTTLMLNCYTRLKDLKKLDDFIAENEIDCDVDVAVRVCCGAGYFDHALTIASKYKLHKEYLSILINDKKDSAAAMRYLKTLPKAEGKECVLHYGSLLMKNHPEELVDLLVQLCTNPKFNSSSDISPTEGRDYNIGTGVEDPEEFEHLLIGQIDMAITFFEKIMQTRNLTPQQTTCLLSELLHQYSLAPEGQDQTMIEEKILTLFRSDCIKYNLEQTLLMCAKYNFSAGKLIIWEQAGMFEDLMEWHADNGDYKNVVAACQRHAESHNQHLWTVALKLMTRESSMTVPPMDLLNIVLDKIDEFELMPPLEIADCLTSSPHLTLGQVRNYLQKMITAQKAALTNEVSMYGTHHDQLSQTKDNIDTLSSETIYFTNTKCNICNNTLELPSTHFLCRHSYHKHCLDSYSENDDCPICLPEIKKIRQTVLTQKQYLSRQSLLQEQLDKSTDPFSVIADYIGHGVFTQEISIPKKSEETKKPFPPPQHQERQKLNQSTTVNRTSSPIFNQSIQQNIRPITKPVNLSFREHIMPSPASSAKDIPTVQSVPSLNIQQFSQTKPQISENPFEDRRTVDDKSSNPFGDDFEDEHLGANPFDDDYDEAKNPFSEDDVKGVAENLAQLKIPAERRDNPFDETDYDPSLNPFED